MTKAHTANIIMHYIIEKNFNGQHGVARCSVGLLLHSYRDPLYGHQEHSDFCIQRFCAKDITKPAMAALISRHARSKEPRELEESFHSWLADLQKLQEVRINHQ